MAQILRFAPAQAKPRERLMELKAASLAAGMTWEVCTGIFCTNGRTWDDYNDDALQSLINLCLSHMEEEREKAAQAALAAPARKAKVIPFAAPVSPVAPKDAKAEAHRRAMIIKAKMRLKTLYAKLPEFNEDMYRYVLTERWGVDSSTKMDNAQLHELLLYLSDLGRQTVKIKRGGGKAKSSEQSGTPALAGHDAPALLYSDPSGLGRAPLMRRINAALAEKGTKEGRYITWNYALGILKKLTGQTVTEWDDALPVNLSAVISALLNDAKRKGRRAR